MSSFLGVDLVEYKKAKRFYREHGENLSSIFNPREVRFIRRAKTPYKNLAKLLAAKEAVYKAGKSGWAGPQSLKSISVLENKNFRFRFIEKKDHVVGLCVGI